MRAAGLQHKEEAGRDLSRLNAKRLWDSIAKRKAVFANDEITKASELNDLYLLFESDNQGECREILEEVNCNVHGHRI